jgi:hypothetical protein
VDPVLVEVERLGNAADTALASNDLPAAKRAIATLREKKPDHASLATLTTRLETAEREAQQTAFNGFIAEAEKALEQHKIPAAREAMEKAAEINNDDPRITKLQASLAKLDTPAATPASVAATPSQPAPAVEKTTPKPVAKRTEPKPETRRKEEPPPKRTAARSEPAPEPRPQQQSRPPPQPQPPAPTTTSRPSESKPRKPISSIPGS